MIDRLRLWDGPDSPPRPLPETTIITLAAIGGCIALACAIACACASVVLAHTARRTAPRAHSNGAPRLPGPQVLPAPTPVPVPTMHLLPPAPQPQPLIVMMPPTHSPGPGGNDGSGLVLEGRYPQLGQALGAWLQVEDDEIERVRIARDLGRIGDGDAARALLDGVRSGVISPTIAADNLRHGGFDAGIAVAAAMQDPEPRVRALATSIVGRRAPLARTAMLPGQLPAPGSNEPDEHGKPQG